MKRVLTILILLVSCTPDEEVVPVITYDVGAVYRPYVIKFNNVYQTTIDNLIIREVNHQFEIDFDSIRTTVPSNSYTVFGQHFIEIDTSYFNRLPRLLEQTIFHHLGALYFEREYEWEFVSLMYWNTVGVGGYSNEGVNYYRYELLRNAPEHIRKKYTYTGPYDGCLILRGDGTLPCGGGNPHGCDEPDRLVCDG